MAKNNNMNYILIALAPMIAGMVVFTALSFTAAPGNKSPTASFSYSPSSPTTSDTIQFTDASSDEDGQVVSWYWNFGDGATSTKQNPTHGYTTAGAYTVTLTVMDDQGATDEYSLVVDVSGPRLEEVMFQNFEPANGTPGPYFRGIYYVNATFENLIVQEGERSVKMTATGEYGGTIGIHAASTLGYLSLQDAQMISLWVYDTQGNNTVQLRLKDSDGDGGSGDDGYFMWSAARSIQNEWTLITWDLRDYPDVPNLDLDRIASIELYEWNPGVYYFDNINFIRLS